ncbi:MAG TPA: hypothetical protein VK324_12470 [Tepidisphaeraceae bacterium]|nr:hypothetical protein [Tepidisphaeraceae bacterium]
MRIGHDGDGQSNGGEGGGEERAWSPDEQVEQALEENDVDAGEALVELVRVIVGRHVDCQRQRSARYIGRPTAGNERPNALTAVCDALHQVMNRGRPLGGPPADAPAYGEPPDRQAVVRQTLWALLLQAQLAAERQAGLLDDEEDGDDGDEAGGDA